MQWAVHSLLWWHCSYSVVCLVPLEGPHDLCLAFWIKLNLV